MGILDQIEAKPILVIGDAMLDMYYCGEVNRISPEAPVPVFHKKSERSVLGGAANVASNLAAIGQNISMLTVIGKDKYGDKILQFLRDKHIHTELIMESKRDTTVKIRYPPRYENHILHWQEGQDRARGLSLWPATSHCH